MGLWFLRLQLPTAGLKTSQKVINSLLHSVKIQTQWFHLHLMKQYHTEPTAVKFWQNKHRKRLLLLPHTFRKQTNRQKNCQYVCCIMQTVWLLLRIQKKNNTHFTLFVCYALLLFVSRLCVCFQSRQNVSTDAHTFESIGACRQHKFCEATTCLYKCKLENFS